jgi:putative transposase
MELGRRQILHHNVTAHPSAEWALQQFREALTEEHPYRFLIHDRDSIFSKDLDQAVTAMGVRILKTPVRAPKANAFCERLVGTIRRECLDFLIPFGERHLKQLLTHWVTYYNHTRVHTSLGPGIPSPIRPSPPISAHRHYLPAGRSPRQGSPRRITPRVLAGEAGRIRLESSFCGPQLPRVIPDAYRRMTLAIRHGHVTHRELSK